MATNFPTSLDSLTNPLSTDTLNSPSHAGQHTDANDAIEALQAKVGVDSSAVTTSLDYKVEKLTGGTTGQVLKKLSNTNFDVQWQTDISGRYYVGDTAPSSPTAGDVWFESDTGRTFVYYDSFWVEFGANAGIPLPGSNGDVLVSDSGSTSGLRWQGQTNSGRNFVINGGFSVWQRGTSFAFTGSAPYYTVDRWQAIRGAGVTGGTLSRQTSGVDGFTYAARVQRDSGNTSTQPIYLSQSFETVNVRSLHNKTLTISFWAKCGANYSPTSSILNVEILTGTGTDGNAADGLTSQANLLNTTATLTTSFQRFSFTTSSTLANTKTQLAVRFNAVPVGTASTNDWFEITGVQLEAGSVATGFDFEPYETTLRKCQRYYYRFIPGAAQRIFAYGQAVSTTAVVVGIFFPTLLRIRPTALETSGVASEYGVFKSDSTIQECNAVPSFNLYTSANLANVLASVSGNVVAGNATALMTSTSANSNTYLAWSAEL